MPFLGISINLDQGDILRRGAFRSLLDIKRHLIAVIEGFETGRVNPRMMHEHVRTVLLLNEPETFLVVEPLHNSIFIVASSSVVR